MVTVGASPVANTVVVKKDSWTLYQMLESFVGEQKVMVPTHWQQQHRQKQQQLARSPSQ